MRRFLFALSALFVGPFVLAAQANNVTPNHVYQLVDTIANEVDNFHRAGFTEPREIFLNLTERQPRHVLQKAQEVSLKVQKLRKVHGMSSNPVDSLPVRDVKPADVRQAVDRISKDIQDLRSVYGTSPAAEAPLPSGKKPTDVYANLANVSVSLGGLGIPAILPNDVYRLAQTIVGDLRLIAGKKGLNANPSSPSGSTGKKPDDVYEAAHALLGKLKILTEGRSGYEVPGGVVLLNKRRGKITPPYVMDVLDNALAEIGAIKNVAGVTKPTTYVALEVGKTPSDVFDTVKQAEALVDVLIAG